MIKAFLILFSFGGALLAAENTPASKSLGALPLHEYNLIKLENNNSFALGYRQLPSWENQFLDQTSLRARTRVFPWLKLGIGHVWQKGERHNFDWVKEPVWKWKNTEKRIERLSQFEIIPRWLWGRSILEWRQTFSYNDVVESSKLISRLGVNFHSLSLGKSRLSFIAQVEGHIPFSEKEAKETWMYVLPLVHLNRTLKIGPQVGYAQKTWNSTADFEDLTGKSFEESEEFFFAGLRVLNVF